ncbi:MAG: hypothetical protein ABIO45_06245 [Burkholderiaceae bacterium]
MTEAAPPAPLLLGRVPRQAFVFSGHMADVPGRREPRFPAALWPAARTAIDATLERLGAGPGDLALTQGAAGGDLLFAEACAARGVPLQFLLPLPEARFIATSVAPSEGHWVDRYLALRPHLLQPPAVLAQDKGRTDSEDAFERCNHWLLDTALGSGSNAMQLIGLWNGEAGDGRGGTAHMMDEARRRGGQVTWIDTRRL